MVQALMVWNLARRPKALRVARERQRAYDAAQTKAPEAPQVPEAMLNRQPTDTDRRRLAAATCGWCDSPIEIKARGRIPKWCSAACRQRAWEQSRAAASGRSAVEIVERRVEVPVQHPAKISTPRHQQWVGALDELAAQLDTGVLYGFDLSELTYALNRVLDAVGRRPNVRQQTGRR